MTVHIKNKFEPPLDTLGADAHRWQDAFGPDQRNDWDDVGGGWFDVRDGGESVAALTIVYIPAHGWSLERRRAFGGDGWVSVGDARRLGSWVADDRLQVMPVGSFLDGPTAAREVVRFLHAPLAVPDGSTWIDSTRLDWPEQM